MKCDRCGNEVIVHTMSMFNMDEICMPCKNKEVKHPLYEKARESDEDQISKGNFNFKGVGKPVGL